MDVSYYPYLNGDGEITGVIVHCYESNKQQRITKEIKQTQQFSENILENANTLVVTLDAEARTTSCNKYAEQTTGYQKDEVIGQNGIEGFIPPKDHEDPQSVFVQEILEYETNIVPGMDVMEHKQKEEALHKDKKQLQHYVKVIDKIGMGAYVINADYRLQTMNKKMIDWFGDSGGSKCYKVIMGKSSPCSFCKLQDVVEQQETARYQFIGSDGNAYETVVSPLCNDDGTISKIGIIRDITEQQKQNDRRVETSNQEEQRLRFENLKAMAGAITHHFNNAMTVVKGNLELMQYTLPDVGKEYEMAMDASRAASGVSRIGSMMLGYVGQKPLQLQTLSFPILVKESVKNLKDNFQSSVSVKFDFPDQDLYCSVDQVQIKEVLESVITNAAESLGKSKGSIEITFGSKYYAANSFPLPFHGRNTTDGMYQFCEIKDSGHGIDPENISRIFEPFYTTQSVGRGLGLGLAMTVGVMQAHHGAITVASSQGKGTVVRILFPVIPTFAPNKLPKKQNSQG